MNYEDKYKEALERAKTFQARYGGDYAEYIFPELRESEDERIRKEIIHYLFYTAGGLSIEEQNRWIAYLEKQKENPKSCDSIPSDCASDAKYEGGWHKVGDSLPDNPREVICKDEAGNYFIGRYYVGEGWDISNYDDEDKSHHLNPPVSKWIDFPLEKQKEQKPAEWSEEDEEVMEDLYNFVISDFIQDHIHETRWKPWKTTLERNRQNRLKSIRPVSKESLQSWKPTEEQMDVFDTAAFQKGVQEGRRLEKEG